MGIAQDRHLNRFIDYNGVTAKIGDEFISGFDNNNRTRIVSGIAIEGISGPETHYTYKLRFIYKDTPGSGYTGGMYVSAFTRCIILNKFKSIQIK